MQKHTAKKYNGFLKVIAGEQSAQTTVNLFYGYNPLLPVNIYYPGNSTMRATAFVSLARYIFVYTRSYYIIFYIL